MAIWDICIKRPIFTVMLVSAPLVLGLVAYNALGVDLFPNVELPVVVVTTTLKGASVEVMETSVTKPLEEIINTVNGIDELRSTTQEGISRITVQFFLDKNRDVAAQEVRDKISTIMAQLPEGVDPPIIDKFDLDAMPVMTIAVAGKRAKQEITEIARKRIKEDIESLSGVGAAILAGGRQRAVNIWIDTDKLTSYHLSIAQVRDALARENLELPGGRVDQGQREVVLRTMGRMETPGEFRDLIVTNMNGYPVRIRDVGRVEDTFEEPRGLARLDGNAAVSLIVQKQSGANTVAVVERVRNRLKQIQSSLPPDITTFIVKDQAKFIVNSMEELKLHLVIAAFLVAGTILIFIRDWRTTIIATLSIPASIVATFAFMQFMGYTLNNIVMLGLILAVGIVIDDAVVIHENIFRHMEEYGRSAREAASTGTREIALAVVATTLSLLVIFTPVIFMSGRVGKFFSSFGATVAFAIFMSMCISFTMTPMLCSRFLVLDKKRGSKSGRVWQALDRGYGGLLRWSLGHRWAIVLACFVLLASTPALFRAVGFDFIPRDDQSEFEVAVTMPEGYSLRQADELFAEIEGRIAGLRGVTDVFSSIGDTSGRVSRGQGDVTIGNIYARMTDLEDRTVKWYDVGHWCDGLFGRKLDRDKYFSQFEVQNEARRIMTEYPDLRVSVQDVAAFQAQGFRQSMIDFNLRGPNLENLQLYSDQIMAWMKRDPRKLGLAVERRGHRDWSETRLLAAVDANLKKDANCYGALPPGAGYFVDVDTSLTLRKPELLVKPDRRRASDLGVPVQAMSATLEALVGGLPVSKYKEFDEQYDVWLRAELPDRDRKDSIARLMVPSLHVDSSGAPMLIELANVADLVPAKGPSTIDRYGMQRQVVVTANLEGNKALGEAADELERYVKSMHLPVEYRGEFLGRVKTLKESNGGFGVAFLVSFLFMYMILAAQFESFIHPITILVALPLTLPFAVLSLILLRTNLDIYAMFGLFMLFGIVKKNGILQVDYTNVLRARGMPRTEAILEANHTRLRPILMTTMMLIAAMVPIALGQGPGAASRGSLAKVILGGQSLSLLLTLLVVPVAYTLWDDLAILSHRLATRIRGSGASSEPAKENEESSDVLRLAG
jgi:hydrophobic/amphiphilic exporter-1 (mainly G- bacteria), HAE1 family